MRRFKLLAFFVIFSICIFVSQAPAVHAHPFKYSAVNTKLTIHDNQITLHTQVHQKIQIAQADDNNTKKVTEQYFSRFLVISNGPNVCKFNLNSFNNPISTQTVFDGIFTCKSKINNFSDLQIHNELFDDQFANIDHFVSISLQNKQINLIFTSVKLDYPRDVKPVPKTALGRFVSVEKQFIWLGIKHIWTGYDHILFLLSIILLLVSVRKIILLVTSFTIAHSITLILAGLHLIIVSSRLVEPFIALTIIYTVVRNIQILLHKKKVNIIERQAATTGFGLIHGLGFASALLGVNVPQGYLVPSLLFFNVGVEIGQLCILLILVPILFWLYRLKRQKEVFLVIMVTVGLLAAFWFLERILAY